MPPHSNVSLDTVIANMSALTTDNRRPEGLSDSTSIHPVSTKQVKELSQRDQEALSAKEWKKFYTFTVSDGGDTDGDTGTSTDGDVGSIIAAYIVYYGRKMGVFRKW